MWDKRAELSHRNTTKIGAPGRNRTCDTRFRNPLHASRALRCDPGISFHLGAMYLPHLSIEQAQP
jgi:hypothetical protein